MAFTNIKKVGGGSKGVTIHPLLLEEAEMKLGDDVKITVKGKKIIIEKVEV